MRAYIANTDYDWFEFFLARPEIDEVNFWRPGSANFQALTPGEQLVFRLKACARGSAKVLSACS